MKPSAQTINLFLVWILFSLLAIAYIGQHPFLGLAIAIIGGIILGVLSFLYYDAEPHHDHDPPAAEEDESPPPS